MSDIDEVSSSIGNLEGRVKSVEENIVEMKADIRELLDIANKGKGALFAVLKVGGIVAAICTAGAWVYNTIFHPH